MFCDEYKEIGHLSSGYLYASSKDRYGHATSSCEYIPTFVPIANKGTSKEEEVTLYEEIGERSYESCHVEDNKSIP